MWQTWAVQCFGSRWRWQWRFLFYLDYLDLLQWHQTGRKCIIWNLSRWSKGVEQKIICPGLVHVFAKNSSFLLSSKVSDFFIMPWRLCYRYHNSKSTYHVESSPCGILSQPSIDCDHSIEWMNCEESRVILKIIDDRILGTGHITVCGGNL